MTRILAGHIGLMIHDVVNEHATVCEESDDMPVFALGNDRRHRSRAPRSRRSTSTPSPPITPGCASSCRTAGLHRLHRPRAHGNCLMPRPRSSRRAAASPTATRWSTSPPGPEGGRRTTAAPSTKFYAPQYRSDREWYDNTVFPGEPGHPFDPHHCYSSGQTWPLGQRLDQPFSKTAH